MVCTEIRSEQGTPVERLKWAQEFMLQEDANHFEAAVEMMALLGVGVWLCTDLEKTFVMDTELEFTMMWQDGYFNARREKAFIFLPVNPLVNRLLSCLKEPVELEAHGRGYEMMRAAEERHRVRSPEEMLVLDLIRSDGVDTVEAVSPTGEVEMVRTTTRHEATADINRLLDEPYQRLTVVKKDGSTVLLEQERTIKPKKAAR